MCEEAQLVILWLGKLYTQNRPNGMPTVFLRLGSKQKALIILGILEQNPFQNPPPYEKLVGDLAGFYSRRINIQHRIVYQVYKAEKVVKVIRMWTHYE